MWATASSSIPPPMIFPASSVSMSTFPSGVWKGSVPTAMGEPQPRWLGPMMMNVGGKPSAASAAAEWAAIGPE